jgi:hypothetical protein
MYQPKHVTVRPEVVKQVVSLLREHKERKQQESQLREFRPPQGSKPN